jgi:hypothetical protein
MEDEPLLEEQYALDTVSDVNLVMTLAYAF